MKATSQLCLAASARSAPSPEVATVQSWGRLSGFAFGLGVQALFVVTVVYLYAFLRWGVAAPNENWIATDLLLARASVMAQRMGLPLLQVRMRACYACSACCAWGARIGSYRIGQVWDGFSRCHQLLITSCEIGMCTTIPLMQPQCPCPYRTRAATCI